MGKHTVVTTKRGYALIRDPLLNKGSAFSEVERDQLGLNGLLPPQPNTQDQQAARALAGIRTQPEPLDKYVSLSALQDRNEHLFYRVLGDHINELMPIVYTPTVGLATQNFSQVFQRGRGLWINPSMRGQIAQVLRDATHDRDVRLLVATDNESILGIGDQGAGGMAISIGKLALYVAGAGIHPARVLPVSLDVGTNNETLLNDDLYLGWRAPRLTGAEYDEFIAEFVTAVQDVFPQALLQWEDFRKDNALRLMEQYRDSILSFNDDIQGTGAVALTGIMSGLRIAQRNLADTRILIHGAGAAGIGISRQVRSALSQAGVNDTHKHLCVLDSRGLLVDDQPFRDAYKAEMAWPVGTAQALGLGDPQDRDLASVVERFQPHVLVGASGQQGAFSEAIIRNVSKNCERPIVLPFSNPTSHAEAQPADVIAWSNGQALVATGSPFAPVEFNGLTHKIGQGNNVFIFPGLGLGALAAQASTISDGMVTAAAQACAEAVTTTELEAGLLFPEVERLRPVTLGVARAVAEQARAEGLCPTEAAALDDAFAAWAWNPTYPEVTPG